MFEAVNSVISNAPLLRAGAERISPATVDLSQLGPVSTPQVPYISLHISVDLDFDKAVLQIRDTDTGDVLSQFPSEETLAARQRRLESQTRAETRAAEVSVSAPLSSPASGQVISIQSAISGAGGSEPSGTPQIVASALNTASQSGNASPRAQAVSIQA